MIVGKFILSATLLIGLFGSACNQTSKTPFIIKYKDIDQLNINDTNCVKFLHNFRNAGTCEKPSGIGLSLMGDTIKMNGRSYTREQFFNHLMASYSGGQCACIYISDNHITFNSIYNAFANIYHNLELQGANSPKICWQSAPWSLSLPKPKNEAGESKMQLYVDQDLSMRLNNEPIEDKAALSRRIAELKPDVITLHLHKDIKVQDMVDIMQIGADQGIKMILATDRSSSPAKEM